MSVKQMFIRHPYSLRAPGVGLFRPGLIQFERQLIAIRRALDRRGSAESSET
jgi:hypothetical protein